MLTVDLSALDLSLLLSRIWLSPSNLHLIRRLGQLLLLLEGWALSDGDGHAIHILAMTVADLDDGGAKAAAIAENRLGLTHFY